MSDELSNEAVDKIIDDELHMDDDDHIISPIKNKGGRPGKLTPQVQQDIISAIAAGNYIVVAVEFAGIKRSTFYHWLKMGREHPRGKYGKFVDEVRRAVRAAEVSHVAVLSEAARNGNVDAAKFWLSRKCYTRWGDRSKLDVEHKNAVVTLKYVDDWGATTVKVEDSKKKDSDKDDSVRDKNTETAVPSDTSSN